MIEFLKGTVFYAENDYVAVDVGGIGYQVHVSHPRQFGEGESVCLYTHLVIREDAHLLYGFSGKDERDLFRTLLEVSGVGPKAALGMLASMNPRQLVTAIRMEDVKTLTRLPGVGKKTAQRLVLDLKDKLAKWDWEWAVQPKSEAIASPEPVSNERDVIAALMALGYNEEEAEWAAREAFHTSEDPTLETEKWIKMALRMMMKR